MSKLLDMLRALPPAVWAPLEPGDPDALARIEQRFGVQLPEDYRDLMIYSDGGSLSGPGIEINLELTSGLVPQNLDERFTKELPGMFVIGDDGAGGIFFYDPKNRLGHGNYSLYCVKLGVLSFEYSVFVATTLTEAVPLVLGGAEFRKHTAP
jgi:hypothetical protein